MIDTEIEDDRRAIEARRAQEYLQSTDSEYIKWLKEMSLKKKIRKNRRKKRKK